MSYRPTLFICSVCFDWTPSEKESYQIVGVCQECANLEQELDEMRSGNFNRSEYGGPETKPNF